VAVASALSDEALRIEVRAPRRGEGLEIAALWKELWDLHEGWGGYPGARAKDTYALVARRIDVEATQRSGDPLLGKHIHLVATLGGAIVGQVEGWLDRLGSRAPITCELRSLVVAERARGFGVGRTLVRALEQLTQQLVGEGFVVAEVLGKNPWFPFYLKIGYEVINVQASFSTQRVWPAADLYAVQVATAHDALALALFDGKLAHARQQRGDVRFDGPRAIDATLLGAISMHIARSSQVADSVDCELLVMHPEEGPVASASLSMHALEPPFALGFRAVLGRFTLDSSARAASGPLAAACAYAAQVFRRQGVEFFELTDLPTLQSGVGQAAIELGGKAWSRVIGKRLSTG
jgi:GNAT superfamily N-acetyltransferase